LSLWGGPQNVARAPGGDSLRYTVIPLPVQPSDDYTMERRADAVALTYSGMLSEAVDLYRGTVEADGWMSGILDTMAHGLLGLPLSFQGDPAMCSALLNADGTPGDFARMHPENECAKIFRDGLGLGIGLGQYLLTCWRCDSVDLIKVETMAGAGAVDVCKCCGARMIDRPAGTRQIFQLRWRDPRSLYRNPITFQWYFDGRSSRIPITPGDGEWFLFQTVPDLDCWRHGPWVWATIAAIFSRDSTYDAQNTSAVCAPTHVFQAQGGTAPATRDEVQIQAEKIQFNNRIVLPGEWKHEIHAATSAYIEVTGSIVERCAGMFEVGITGNLHGVKSGTGFANMDVYARATRERRAFYAGAWIRQIAAQGLVWWGSDNYGTRNVPVGAYDVRSPEDKLAQSKADEAEGIALKSMGEAYDALGYELVPEYVVERAQSKGVRIQRKPGNASAAKLPLGVEAVGALVMGDEGRQNLGLGPFPDARGTMTISEINARGAAGQMGAPAPTLPPVAPIAGARVADEEEDGPAEPEYAAQLAASLNGHVPPVERCRHEYNNRCPKCGIKRQDTLVSGVDGGGHSFKVNWVPIAAPAPLATSTEAA
jgi:hypothetical protein